MRYSGTRLITSIAPYLIKSPLCNCSELWISITIPLRDIKNRTAKTSSLVSSLWLSLTPVKFERDGNGECLTSQPHTSLT